MILHEENRDKQLSTWLDGSRARLLVQREQALLRDVLAYLTGFRLLQVGSWGFAPELLDHAGTLCHWRLAQWPCRGDDVGFDGANLPLASGSIDALLLAHSLDFAWQPHQLLRECERVLSDRGQLVLLGFNPFSLWATAQRLPWRTHGQFVRPAHFYGARRVCDWLHVLGFEPQRLVRYGVGFPFFRGSRTVPCVEGRGRMTLVGWTAQAYLIVARKRVLPLTRIHWRDPKAAQSASGKIGLANHGARRVNSRR